MSVFSTAVRPSDLGGSFSVVLDRGRESRPDHETTQRAVRAHVAIHNTYVRHVRQTFQLTRTVEQARNG